jgi:hypothetical protein
MLVTEPEFSDYTLAPETPVLPLRLGLVCCPFLFLNLGVSSDNALTLQSAPHPGWSRRERKMAVRSCHHHVAIPNFAASLC